MYVAYGNNILVHRITNIMYANIDLFGTILKVLFSCGPSDCGFVVRINVSNIVRCYSCFLDYIPHPDHFLAKNLNNVILSLTCQRQYLILLFGTPIYHFISNFSTNPDIDLQSFVSLENSKSTKPVIAEPPAPQINSSFTVSFTYVRKIISSFK